MSMGWEYPPGVSGNEYAIAGADREWDEMRWCIECGATVGFGMASYGASWWGEDDAGHTIEGEYEPGDFFED